MSGQSLPPAQRVARPQPGDLSMLLAHSTPGMPTNTDLGRTIARLRAKRGLSVELLARIADCTPAWLADAERGAFGPTWTELCLLAQALDLPVSDFIEETEREARAREARPRAGTHPPGPP